MLQIKIVKPESWDEANQIFVKGKVQLLILEHSLVSLSKWESKWCKPFLTKETKSTEETIDYIRCMTLTQNVDPEMYEYISNENIIAVNNYIEAPMTATWFSDEKDTKPSREQITAELIYYWMISLNVPFECQKWHLNRLLTLIKVCNVKNQPAKKKNMKDIMSRNAAINAKRRKQMNSNG